MFPQQHIAVQVLTHRQFSIKGFVHLECDIIGPTSSRSYSSLPTQVDISMCTGNSARNSHHHTIRDHLALIDNHPTTSRDLGLQNSSVNLYVLSTAREQTSQNTRVRVQQRAAERALSSLCCPQFPLPPRPHVDDSLIYFKSLSVLTASNKSLLCRFTGTDDGQVAQYLGCQLIRDDVHGWLLAFA